MDDNTISEYDRDNLDKILTGYGTWYSACLFRLIDKADLCNIKKLEIIYPDHVKLVKKYLGV